MCQHQFAQTSQRRERRKRFQIHSTTHTSPPPTGQQANQQPVQTQRSAGGIVNQIFRIQPQLEGTVISVEAPYHEPSDFDSLKRVLGCLVILPVLPVLIALVIVLGFFRINLLHAVGILHLFRFGREPRERLEPVRNFRVRDPFGNEHQVRMKGHLKVGNVSVGDRLTIWGKWKHGTLQLERAFNHRTSSQILLKKINWVRLVGFFLIIYAILLILSSLGMLF